MFNLTIDTGNAEMRNPSDIADALQGLSERLADSRGYQDSGIIRDVNGNTVGRWEYRLDLTEDEDE